MAYQVQTVSRIIDDLHSLKIPVHEVRNWQSRGSINFGPRGLVVHHTADGAGDYPSQGIVTSGRSGLPGPLAQFGLGRSGGVWIIAAGRANHAGAGGWKVLSGNTAVWGIEAESRGTIDDWTPEQRRNYPILSGLIARHTGFGVEMICGHKEWAPSRKRDPAFYNMNDFRQSVARFLTASAIPGLPKEEEEMLVPIYLEAGKSHPFHIEPSNPERGAGYLGTKGCLMVLNTFGDRSNIWVWSEHGHKGGITIVKFKPWTVELPGGALDLRNDGPAPVFGSLLYRK